MDQIQTNNPADSDAETTSGLTGATSSAQVPSGLDDLLDEIEDLVAKDAQSFVQGFVQEGGE